MSVFDNDLRKAGLKVTAPRMKILELLTESGRHLSAEEIYRELNNQGEEVGLATVYRVLTQFEQAGIIEKHQFENNFAVFEMASDHHHDHIVCQSCGKVVEFTNSAIEDEQRKVAQSLGFVLTGHSLNLYGYCDNPECQAKSKKATFSI